MMTAITKLIPGHLQGRARWCAKVEVLPWLEGGNGKELDDDQGYPEPAPGWQQMSRQNMEAWLLGSSKPLEQDSMALCEAEGRG